METISLFGSHVMGLYEAWDMFMRNGWRLAKNIADKMAPASEAHNALIEDANAILTCFDAHGFLKEGAHLPSLASKIGSLLARAAELVTPEDIRHFPVRLRPSGGG